MQWNLPLAADFEPQTTKEDRMNLPPHMDLLCTPTPPFLPAWHSISIHEGTQTVENSSLLGIP